MPQEPGAPESPGDARFADTHVRLLGVLFCAIGALALIVGAALLLLASGAAALAPSASPGGELATQVTAATLSAFGAVVILGGVAHVWVGSAFGRRRPFARLAAILLALPDLLLLPFGTLVGAYGLWVLLDERVRRQFDAGP